MNLKEQNIPQGILGNDEKFIKRTNDLFGQYLPDDIGDWKGQRIREENGSVSLRFETHILLPTGDEHTSRLTLSPDTGLIERSSYFLKTPKNPTFVRTLHIDRAYMMVSAHYPGLFNHKDKTETTIFGFYRSREQKQVPWGTLDIFHAIKGSTNRLFLDVNSFYAPLLKHPLPNAVICLRHNRLGSNDDQFSMEINGSSISIYEYKIFITKFTIDSYRDNYHSPYLHYFYAIDNLIGPDFEEKLGIFPIQDSSTLKHHFKTQVITEVKRPAHDYFTPSWAS
jgi:hypothetical protein